MDREMEHCRIIGAICPYEHGCDMCRLHNDYETAKEKARKIETELEERRMTEQEAIELLQEDMGKVCIVGRQYEAMKLAVSALEEIQQYRACGTVKAVQELKECAFSGIELAKIAISNQILKDYGAIGTVREFREAAGRRKPAAPYIWSDGYADGKPVYDMYDCPNCGESYEIDSEKYDYCPKCGQALEWGT